MYQLYIYIFNKTRTSFTVYYQQEKGRFSLPKVKYERYLVEKSMGIFHANRIPVEMSAPRTRAEPLNLVDGRFPGSGSSPGAEGSSLLCRLSICLSTCVYVTRTDPLDNNCLLRSRVVRSFKPFGHNFVRTVVCQFRFVHHRFSTRFSYSEILFPLPADTVHKV